MPDSDIEISAIVPVGRRTDDVSALIEEYGQVLWESKKCFELIAVIDGPHGSLQDDLFRLSRSRPWLLVVELTRESGESAALTAGFGLAHGEKCLTRPGYRQVAPGELHKLIERGSEVDMAVAVRWPRSGSLLARTRRASFHGLLKLLTGQKYRDLACWMRLFKREIADEIPLYSDRHHFYPVLAKSRGFSVAEVEVTQGSGDVFPGPHSIRQYLHRLLDILTLFFLVRFTKKPLRFFGTVGFLVGALGVVFLSVLVVQRLAFGIGLADRPALLLSSLMVVLGVQIFALGLIGELIIFTHAAELKEYAIRRIISAEPESEPEVEDHEGRGS
jgi:hypothetical protein